MVYFVINYKSSGGLWDFNRHAPRPLLESLKVSFLKQPTARTERGINMINEIVHIIVGCYVHVAGVRTEGGGCWSTSVRTDVIMTVCLCN